MLLFIYINLFCLTIIMLCIHQQQPSLIQNSLLAPKLPPGKCMSLSIAPMMSSQGCIIMKECELLITND